MHPRVAARERTHTPRAYRPSMFCVINALDDKIS
jgi:hypothetical protein